MLSTARVFTHSRYLRLKIPSSRRYSAPRKSCTPLTSTSKRSFYVSKWAPNPYMLITMGAAPVIAAVVINTEPKNEDVVEPRTGLKVPQEMFGDQVLVGTSARSVTVFGFLTYAFALYRSSSNYKQLISEGDSSKVLPAIVADPVDTTLRIVTYRIIDCTHFCSSINASIQPRIKRALEKESLDPSQASEKAETICKEFRSCFKGKDLPVNTPVDFRITRHSKDPKDTSVHVYINGKEEGQVEGRLFTTALMDMFFGPEPKSKEISAGIQASIDKAIKK